MLPFIDQTHSRIQSHALNLKHTHTAPSSMRFEKYLKASKEPAWASYYIAYGDLKDILKESLERQRAAALLRASNRRLRQQSSATDFWNLDASVQPPVVDDAFSKVGVSSQKPSE